MSTPLTGALFVSILLRVVGIVASLHLQYRVRDRRFTFLTLLLSLMALRQILTLFGIDLVVSELPGLAVSVLAIFLVYYLSRYVEQEQDVREDLEETNRRLRDHRNRLEAAMGASPDYIFVFDTEGRYQEILSGEDDITIRPPDELIGNSVHDVLPVDAAEAIERAIEEAVRTGETSRVEYSIPLEEGLAWYDGRAALIDHPGSESRRVLFIARDVTEVKERERALRRFRRAVEAAGHAIYITDRDGTIRYVNSAFEAVTGYSEEEAIGRTPRILSSDEQDDSYYGELWETILSGELWHEEITNCRRSGQRYYADQTVAPIFDDDGEIEGFVAIQTDVTDRKERERQLAVLDRVLRHNMRNDMSVVLGYADMIAEDTSGETARAAAAIRRTGRDLLDVVDKEREIVELLSSAPSAETVDLSSVVRDCVERVRGDRPDADLAVRAPATARATAIPEVRRAIRELVENAIVHSDRDAPRVELSVTVLEEAVEVRIADQGPGIPDQERSILAGERDIEPLYHGSGMGLWLVHWIVRLSDGHLAFDENDPRGCLVTISLDRSDGG
jgi:PAS domain S-box-containing protein